MREYILTDKEREVLKAYLENGKKLYGIHQLKNRAKQHYARLKEDMSLIEKIV